MKPTQASVRAPSKWQRSKRSLVRIAVALGVIYAVYVGIGAVLFGKVLFPIGMIGPVEGGPDAPQGFETLWITARDGSKVEAWFLTGAGCSAQQPGPALMYFHGNGELIGHNTDIARMFAAMGVSTLLVEYRGYGRSGGSPSEAAIVEDARVFLERLLERSEVDPIRLLYFGRSLGTGVAAQTAAYRKPRAMILHSPFTSIAAMGWRYGMPPFLCPHPFRSDLVLPTIGCPVLIFHGDHDEVIPFAHGERVHAMTPGSVFVPLDGGHNDTPQDWDEYERTIGNFLEQCGVIPARGR